MNSKSQSTQGDSNVLPHHRYRMGSISGSRGRKLYPGNPVVLVPLGSLEDQGPHAPMGDYLMADKVAEIVAQKANKAGAPTVVAPVIPFGCSDFFDGFPGGIDIRHGTLMSLLEDVLEALRRNGLTRIIFLNGHAGNVNPIMEVTKSIHRRHGLVVPSFYLWQICYEFLPALIGQKQAAESSGHGANPLASVAMHLSPELIDYDEIPAAKPLKNDPLFGLRFRGLGFADFEGISVGLPNAYEDIYTLGVGKGDARMCSANTGALITEKLTDIIARFVVLQNATTGPQERTHSSHRSTAS